MGEDQRSWLLLWRIGAGKRGSREGSAEVTENWGSTKAKRRRRD